MRIKKIILARNTSLELCLSFLAETKAGILILEIERDCSLVTEPFFGKKIKSVLQKKTRKEEERKSLEGMKPKNQPRIIFITQKKFFQSLLEKQGFEVFSKIPDDFENIEAVSLISKSPSEKFMDVTQDKTEKQKHITKTKNDKEKKIGKQPKFSAHKIEMIEEKSSLRGIYFFLILGIIAGLVGLYFWIAPQVIVSIEPKISIVPITHNIIVTLPNAVLDENDENLPRLGGILNETLIEKKQKYPTTKKTYDVTNARGKLTIYNETKTEKYLVPSRLQTSDGLIFRMVESVTVPPKSGNAPGRTTVEVIADETDVEGSPVGSRGNILAGETLFFPALRKDLQELYYAKTDKGPLVGGSTLVHHFVGKDDFQLAKPLFENFLLEEGRKSLIDLIQKQSQREGKYYILLNEKEALLGELVQYNFNPQSIGKEQKEFEVSGQLKVSGVVFNQDEVIEILKQKIEKSQDTDKELIFVDPNSIEYRVLHSEQLVEDRWVKLTVSMKGIERLSFKKNRTKRSEFENRLKKDILGKSIEEAKSILVNNPQIKNILDITVQPFWKKNIPIILDQIEFKIEDEVLPEYKAIYHSTS